MSAVPPHGHLSDGRAVFEYTLVKARGLVLRPGETFQSTTVHRFSND